jgi:hypothetical protein
MFDWIVIPAGNDCAGTLGMARVGHPVVFGEWVSGNPKLK